MQEPMLNKKNPIPVITDVSLGQRIKFIRKFRGMKQKELEAQPGIKKRDGNRMGQYEMGYRVPNKKTLIAIAETLDVSLEALSSTIPSSRKELMQNIFWWDFVKGQDDIFECIEEWQEMRRKRKYGEITDEEYLIWHLTYSGLSDQ